MSCEPQADAAAMIMIPFCIIFGVGAFIVIPCFIVRWPILHWFPEFYWQSVYPMSGWWDALYIVVFWFIVAALIALVTHACSEGAE